MMLKNALLNLAPFDWPDPGQLIPNDSDVQAALVAAAAAVVAAAVAAASAGYSASIQRRSEKRLAVERAHLEVRLVSLQEDANDRLQEALISSQRKDAAHARVISAATDLIDAATRVGQGKTESFDDVRISYHRFWLISTTLEAQEAARLLLRTSYQVNEYFLQKRRKRNRHPSSEIRSSVFPFVVAIRKELGIEGEAMPEID